MGKGLTEDLKAHIRIHGRDNGGVTALALAANPKQKRNTVVTAKTKQKAVAKAEIKQPKGNKIVKSGTASPRAYFRAHGGIGFGDVKTLVSKHGYSIERTPYNNRKFVLVDKDNVQHLFNWAPHIKLLHEKLEAIGIDAFLQQYEIKAGANIVNQKTTERKKSKRQIRIEKRENTSRIDQINSRITDITLEIMHYKTVRGSDKHMKLREELRSLHEERRNLGFEKDSQHAINKEDMEEARKRGMEKKKERKAKREAKKKGIARD